MDLKQQGFSFLLTMLLSMMGVEGLAYDAKIDGIYYDFSGTEATVTYLYSNIYNSQAYTGDVVIPSTVTYNGTTYSVTSIGYRAFLSCHSLTSVIIPNSVTTIGKSAFYGCSSLTSVIIPNSVTSIGEEAFGDCGNLTSITVDKSNTVYDSRDNCNAIIETSSNTLISGCKNTIIPNTVTCIGTWAFSSCRGLTNITIPNSVTSIEDYAFWNCSWLTSVDIPNSVTSIGKNVFYPHSLTSITIPNSVTSIGGEAFYSGSGLTSITVDKSNTVYDSRDNCNAIIETSSNTLIFGCKNTIIPNTVSGIGRVAFQFCHSLTNISIPNSVTFIDDGAFNECSGLTSITIPNSVTSIGRSAFSNTAWYNNQPNGIVYAGKVVYIYKGTMPSNTSIVLEEGTLGIADYAFSGCSGLTSITIPNSVTCIGQLAFTGCSGLKSVIIPNSMTSIGNFAFGYCGLTSIDIPNSVTSIGEKAFLGCTDLTSITIPNSVTSIGDAAICGCRRLTSITIPNSVSCIGEKAFFGCSGLTSVTMESMTPTEIEENTFSNRSNATLYVPYGSKEAYKSAEFWKDFKEIVELEPDYNLSNKLVVSDVSVVQGGTVALPIAMENEDEITAFQFELELPNGITVSEATLTSRKSNQTLTYNLLDNGRYQFVAFSSNSQAFSGSEGALVNVLLKAGGTITSGNYTIEVKNIELTTTDVKACNPADCTATLTISNVKLGDANGDGEVNVADIVEIVNSILGKPSAKFVKEAADLNGDSEVSVTDIVLVVNIIMSAQNASARSLGSIVDTPTDGDQLTLTENDGQQLALNLDNQGRYVASQFDVRLSEGQTLEGIKLNSRRLGNHRLTYTQTGSNLYRVIVYSLGNEAFEGDSGELLGIEVTGSGNVGIENALFVTTGQQEKRFAPINGNATTGIDNLPLASGDSQDIFDLQGRRVENGSQKGVYIINGKKQIVK